MKPALTVILAAILAGCGHAAIYPAASEHAYTANDIQFSTRIRDVEPGVKEASVLLAESLFLANDADEMALRAGMRQAALHAARDDGCGDPSVLDFYMPSHKVIKATVRISCPALSRPR